MKRSSHLPLGAAVLLGLATVVGCTYQPVMEPMPRADEPLVLPADLPVTLEVLERCTRLVDRAYGVFEWHRLYDREDTAALVEGSERIWSEDLFRSPDFPVGVRLGGGYIEARGRARLPEAFGYAAFDERHVYLVFRGSKTRGDWHENLRDTQTPFVTLNAAGNPRPVVVGDRLPRVHEGFYELHRQMRSAAAALLAETMEQRHEFFPGQGPADLIVIGHSLGAAVATLMAAERAGHREASGVQRVILVTFASPRVGDTVFAVYLDDVLGVEAVRVVNSADLVPDLPTAALQPSALYQHVGTPVLFTRQRGHVAANHAVWLYREAIQDAAERQDAVATPRGLHPTTPGP